MRELTREFLDGLIPGYCPPNAVPELDDDGVLFVDMGPRRIDPSNSHLAQQLELAYHALQSLTGDEIAVHEIRLGGREPELKVGMPPGARCLPGTTFVRRRGPNGMEHVRRAFAHGCRIEWEVRS